MNQEIWKTIEGYEGIYEISSHGKVKSLKKGLMLKIFLTGKPAYLSVTLCKKGKEKTCRIHRLIASGFIPNPENYPLINHKDGNKLNNNVENLEWCTAAMNVLHSYRVLGKVSPTKGKKLPGVSEKLRGRKLSKETRQKLSKARLGKAPWNKGLKKS